MEPKFLGVHYRGHKGVCAVLAAADPRQGPPIVEYDLTGSFMRPFVVGEKAHDYVIASFPRPKRHVLGYVPAWLSVAVDPIKVSAIV